MRANKTGTPKASGGAASAANQWLRIRRGIVCALLMGVMSPTIASAVIVMPINDPSFGCSLQQAIDAGGLRVGDIVFDGFSINNNNSNGGLAPEASGVMVYGVSINTEIGLRFTGGWSAIQGQFSDTVILFHVEADSPYLLTGASQWMDAYGASNGGLVWISDNVFLSDPMAGFSPSLADGYVYFANRDDRRLFDYQVFINAEGQTVQVQEAWAVKDVVVNGGQENGAYAALSQFYQTFSQVPTEHFGDANADGAVNVGDLGILAANWGQSGKGWDQANFTPSDYVVDVGDLGVLAANWGWVAPGGQGAVPEPATLSLLALGGLTMLRRMRN